MNETAQSSGFIGGIKNSLNSFLSCLDITTALVVETASYFAAGILLGFLAKRYLKQTIVAVLVFFILLKGLEYLGIGAMVFNWDRLKTLTGMGPQDTLDSAAKIYLLWIQTHVRQVVCWVIGFLMGLKLS